MRIFVYAYIRIYMYSSSLQACREVGGKILLRSDFSEVSHDGWMSEQPQSVAGQRPTGLTGRQGSQPLHV